ncbi:hypothetical protein [Streptomyces sp. NBC_00691]|uniref:hypothetical protein n=1 Tax=Streptomyces sp. NBC_00691 TaxID=2903671 RepID=UPI002E32541F|nr:hypothetical protein [Streptomyces sp. NBC_00691]
MAQAVLLVPLALGAGFSLPPLIASMMEAVPPDRAGTAAGLLNAVRQTAGALAIAVFGSLAATSTESALRTSLLISASFLTLTTLASLRLPGSRGRAEDRAGG